MEVELPEKERKSDDVKGQNRELSAWDEPKATTSAGAATKKYENESPNPVLRCINKIPICGGFCAPTISPYEGCLRHFSNEWTPPQPCFRKGGLRACLEHATLPRTFGRVGFAVFERHRDKVMLISTFVSFVSWIFLIFACCAITSNRGVLRNTAWIRVEIDDNSAVAFIGLTHIGFRNRGNWKMVKLDNACNNNLVVRLKSYDDRAAVIVNNDDIFGTSCSECKNSAADSVSLAISGAITQVFQMTTELQRSTRFGDLNCQKLFGAATSVYGLVSTTQSLRGFRKDCGLRAYTPPWRQSEKATMRFVDDGSEVKVKITVRPGIAFILLFVAVWMKALDILFHLLVPTPKPKQALPTDYKTMLLEDYMLLARVPDDQASATNLDEGAREGLSASVC